MTPRFTLSAGLLLLASGAANAQAEAYLCPGFGDVDVRVMLIEGTDAAVAEFITGVDSPSGGSDPVTLRATRRGEAFTYTGGDLTLSGTGDIADLTAGDLTVHCTLETASAAPVEQPVQPVEDSEVIQDQPLDNGSPAFSGDSGAGEATPDAAGGANIPAISLGGNLRAGPGTEFEDVGSLEEGAEIILQADTGVLFNGYNWFEIILPDGRSAFQWGGVICVPGGGVGGVIVDPGACPAQGAVPALADTGAGEATPDAAGAANIAAVTLGGNVRSGPGTAFPDIGGTEEGATITLLSDSGIVFDGYTWWEILLPNGEVAFQWGGVICVPGGGVPGVLANCP